MTKSCTSLIREISHISLHILSSLQCFIHPKWCFFHQRYKDNQGFENPTIPTWKKHLREKPWDPKCVSYRFFMLFIFLGFHQWYIFFQTGDHRSKHEKEIEIKFLVTNITVGKLRIFSESNFTCRPRVFRRENPQVVQPQQKLGQLGSPSNIQILTPGC